MSLKDRFLAVQRLSEGDHGDTPKLTKDAGEAHLTDDKKSHDIGFGHKITNDEWAKGTIHGIQFIDSNGNYIPLDLEQKKTIHQEDLRKNLSLARSHGWDAKLKRLGLEWDSLDERYQLALGDLAFHVGGEKAGKGCTKIFKAIQNKDAEAFVRELRRRDAGENTAGMDNRVAKITYAVNLIDSLEGAKRAGLTLANTNEIPAKLAPVPLSKPITENTESTSTNLFAQLPNKRPSWLRRATDYTTPTTENNETVRTQSGYSEDLGGEVLFPTIRMGEQGLYEPEDPFREALKQRDFILVKGPAGEETQTRATELSNFISNELIDNARKVGLQKEMANQAKAGMKEVSTHKRLFKKPHPTPISKPQRGEDLEFPGEEILALFGTLGKATYKHLKDLFN